MFLQIKKEKIPFLKMHARGGGRGDPRLNQSLVSQSPSYSRGLGGATYEMTTLSILGTLKRSRQTFASITHQECGSPEPPRALCY